jgi:hypothetical protein
VTVGSDGTAEISVPNADGKTEDGIIAFHIKSKV